VIYANEGVRNSNVPPLRGKRGITEDKEIKKKGICKKTKRKKGIYKYTKGPYLSK